jgi:hypothetical protein
MPQPEAIVNVRMLVVIVELESLIALQHRHAAQGEGAAGATVGRSSTGARGASAPIDVLHRDKEQLERQL